MIVILQASVNLFIIIRKLVKWIILFCTKQKRICCEKREPRAPFEIVGEQEELSDYEQQLVRYRPPTEPFKLLQSLKARKFTQTLHQKPLRHNKFIVAQAMNSLDIIREVKNEEDSI